MSFHKSPIFSLYNWPNPKNFPPGGGIADCSISEAVVYSRAEVRTLVTHPFGHIVKSQKQTGTAKEMTSQTNWRGGFVIVTKPSATAQDSLGQTNHPTSLFIVHLRFRERLCSVGSTPLHFFDLCKCMFRSHFLIWSVKL